MKKTLIILTIIILLLSLIGCKQKVNNQELIESFLNYYYSQLVFTDDEWNKIMLEFYNSKGHELKVEEYYIKEEKDGKEEKETISFLNEFNKYLTQECLDKLMRNRYIPNFNMIDSEVDSFEINNLEIEDIDDQNYKIKFELRLLKKDKIEIENKEIEIKIIEDDINNKVLIENLRGEL